MVKYKESIGSYPADQELAFKVASVLAGRGVSIEQRDNKHFNDWEVEHFRVNPKRKDVKTIEVFATQAGDYHNFWVIANAINGLFDRKLK